MQIGDKVWDKDAIHALLDRSDEAVARALMVVYGNQTADERAAFATKHHNGVGFTGADAAKQGWNDESIIIHLVDLIMHIVSQPEKTLELYFSAVADEENGDHEV